MTSSSSTVDVPTHDGQRMPAQLARPSGGRGPGLVVLQEIFGITEYLLSRAQDLAQLGYVALVPQLYWRLGLNLSTDETSQAGLQEAFGLMQRLNQTQAVDDAVAALEYLRQLPDTGGRAGVLGFCMGGRMAYEVGVRSNPDVVVSYYGSGIADQLASAAQLRAPIIFHFGAADAFLPVADAERIRDAFAGRSDMEWHLHADAGHAFDNRRAPMFSYPPAAADAWQQTVAFLQRHFPPNAT